MHENKSLQFQDLDQVFQSAQLRRSADLGGWLMEYFLARRARLDGEANMLKATATLHRQAV
jgi:hypothetical protein